MTSVGYGDITPQNQYEATLILIGMLISSGMFAYTFNSIGVVVEQISNDKKKFKNEISMVNRYLHKKKLSNDLIIQVQKYLEYMQKEENELNFEEGEKFLLKLNPSLREKIIYNANKYLLQKCQKIFNHFSPDIIDHIAQSLTPSVYQKDEIIFDEETFNDDPLFYIIQEGSVQIYVETYKGNIEVTVLKEHQKYDCFGEFTFFTDQQIQVGAKASDQTEKYREIKDNLTLYKKYEIINNHCYNCNKFGHLSTSCPFTHFIGDKEFIILKHIFSSPQERKKIIRYNKVRFNSLNDTQNIIFSLSLFMEEFENSPEFKHLQWLNQIQNQNQEIDPEQEELLALNELQRQEQIKQYQINLLSNGHLNSNSDNLDDIESDVSNIYNYNNGQGDQSPFYKKQFTGHYNHNNNKQDTLENSQNTNQNQRNHTIEELRSENSANNTDQKNIYQAKNESNHRFSKFFNININKTNNPYTEPEDENFKENQKDIEQEENLTEADDSGENQETSIRLLNDQNFKDENNGLIRTIVNNIEQIENLNNLNINNNGQNQQKQQLKSIESLIKNIFQNVLENKTKNFSNNDINNNNNQDKHLLNDQNLFQKTATLNQIQSPHLQIRKSSNEQINSNQKLREPAQYKRENTRYITNKKDKKQLFIHEIQQEENDNKFIKELEKYPELFTSDKPQQFTNYFPKDNLNLQQLVQKIQFFAMYITPPGYGKYTFFWRKISVVGGFRRQKLNNKASTNFFEKKSLKHFSSKLSQAQQQNSNDNQIKQKQDSFDSQFQYKIPEIQKENSVSKFQFQHSKSQKIDTDQYQNKKKRKGKRKSNTGIYSQENQQNDINKNNDDQYN
ncbi:Zinc finger, CCHC-type [Pseudocohnilembus persalinus]|uniref:Zinc finger, CCHC-type n=1 Tax=Pseudocohnilembus persalinus TaxID=266149 RepID=A0A0V0QXG8_PSEPJ|nr:Zinc finger, CCHC-type [Pseudocohnilembus persalinus]|eukprot:KRX06884.1 Zinc finger, CCHC-type [Pseudocohnilembus persalinus]